MWRFDCLSSWCLAVVVMWRFWLSVFLIGCGHHVEVWLSLSCWGSTVVVGLRFGCHCHVEVWLLLLCWGLTGLVMLRSDSVWLWLSWLGWTVIVMLKFDCSCWNLTGCHVEVWMMFENWMWLSCWGSTVHVPCNSLLLWYVSAFNTCCAHIQAQIQQRVVGAGKCCWRWRRWHYVLRMFC